MKAIQKKFSFNNYSNFHYFFGMLTHIKEIDKYNDTVEDFAIRIENKNMPDQLSQIMEIMKIFWEGGVFGTAPFKCKIKKSRIKTPGRYTLSTKPNLEKLMILDNEAACDEVSDFIYDVSKRLGIKLKKRIVNMSRPDGNSDNFHCFGNHGLNEFIGVSCADSNGTKTKINFFACITNRLFLFPTSDGKLNDRSGSRQYCEFPIPIKRAYTKSHNAFLQQNMIAITEFNREEVDKAIEIVKSYEKKYEPYKKNVVSQVLHHSTNTNVPNISNTRLNLITP